MGKKTKIGKSRKDKFYKLAKETGFRSRSAFKLIQLNRKFEFLQKSRVLIDLCAAPGGWLQVASQFMPISSLIVGVDLVPIKSLPNIITLQEDITSDKCRQALKRELKTWKADCVLHDGAPNVGKNWYHDAFQQAQLTLTALRLTTGFLNKGGCFVTKMFRSKDYNSMIWVFKQFFKKVFATKPQASRTESAEIFVVCQSYLAPDKIDPKFMDVKYVFQDVEPDAKPKLNFMYPEKERHRAEGYADGVELLYNKVKVSTFIQSSNYMELLSKCSELFFDDEMITNHPLSTPEIKECCKDIKVLGRKELRGLLTWRKHLAKLLESQKPKEKEVTDSEPVKEVEDDDENERIQKQIVELEEKKALELKRKKKKVLKERQKLQTKMNLNMILPNDRLDTFEEDGLFKLSRIRSKLQLTEIEKGKMLINKESVKERPKPKLMMRGKLDEQYDTVYKEEESEEDSIEDLGGDDQSEQWSDPESDLEFEDDGNPLMLDLNYADKQTKSLTQTELWFKQEAFSGIENDFDEDYDVEMMAEALKTNDDPEKSSQSESKTGSLRKRKEKIKTKKTSSVNLDDDNNENDLVMNGTNSNTVNGGLEIVPQEKTKVSKKRKLLDPTGLAIGALIATSKKNKRDIIDESFNRYTSNDDNLPDWFVKDEAKHYKKNLPVTKEMVQEFKERLKEINARPLKKIIEAKARKKRRVLKRMERARKKAESITEALDMTESEKMHHIKTIYKKANAGNKKKREVTYVVAKKGGKGKVRRPTGIRGRFKMVDKRLKKDKMFEKRKLDRAKQKKKK